MADAYGNILDPPGIKVVTEIKPGDVLASYSPPPLIKGGTVAAAVGALAAGTVMARDNATKKYVAYVDGGAADPAIGVLLQAVDATGGDKLVNIIFRGTVKLDKLVGYDAGAGVDLNARVINRSSEASNAGDYLAIG